MLLDTSFFIREDVVAISKDLLGKVLITEIDGIRTTGVIVETEAYRGPDDLGCHAYNNRRTERTEIMFAKGGVAYVYICYGIHHMFNVVTAPAEKPHAVLIRAIEPLENLAVIQGRRVNVSKKQLTNGPGKVGAALGITKEMNGSDLCKKDDIWIEDRGTIIKPSEIISGPRVGMSVHVGHSSNWPWRFRIKGNIYTSKPDRVWYDWADAGI